MTDPTIPELVARLRELYERRMVSERAHNQWMLAADKHFPTLLDALERGDGEKLGQLRTEYERYIKLSNDPATNPGDLEASRSAVMLRVGLLLAGGGKGLAKEPVPCTICAKPCALYADEIPADGLCPVCRYSMAPDVHRLHGVTFELSWRPISEPPSAEVHAWCGGRYLFEDKHGGVFQENHIRQAFELLGKHSSVFIRWLPIPPSDERRG